MKHPHLRPEWWRPGERRPPRSGDGATSTTNEASRGTSNHPSQATNSATRGIFATQAIGPAAMASGTNIKDSWIADSCSNIHIGNDISKFVQYEEIEPLQIQTGGGLMKAIGVGSVELTVARTDHSAYTITFTEVYHCPDFFTNVVSLNILRRKGAFFNGLHNTINFVKDRAEIAYVPCINGLNTFILVDNPAEVPFAMALATARSRLYEKGVLAKATMETWHKRLQHLPPDRIRLLARGMKGIVVTEDRPFHCEDCHFGKAKKQISRCPQRRSNCIFEKVHVDVVGPLKHEGLHGEKYWVLFTDDRTRFRWIYCISNRGSAASTLKQFVRMIKTQTGITIGCF